MAFLDDEFFAFIENIDPDKISNEDIIKFAEIMGGAEGIKDAAEQCRFFARAIESNQKKTEFN